MDSFELRIQMKTKGPVRRSPKGDIYFGLGLEKIIKILKKSKSKVSVCLVFGSL